MTRAIPVLLFALTALTAAAAAGAVPTQAEPPALSAAAALEQALAAYDAGEPEQGVALLEPFREQPSTPPPLLATLGALYLEVGRPADALEVLAPLAEASPDPAALYNAGRAALALGRQQQAESFLARSVELQRNTLAARELGLIRGQQGRTLDAFRLLRPWALAHPEDTEARLAAALCAVQLSRAPDAEELLSDLPQTMPRVRLLWGKVLLLKGDPHGALATLRPLVEEGGTEVELDARRTMADAHISIGEAAKAVELLAGRAGGDPAVALLLSTAHYQSGDLDGAVAALEPFSAALTRGDVLPQDRTGGKLTASVALEYGRLLVSSGRHEEAIPFLELTTRLNPGGKQGWQSLGRALAAVGRRDEAAAALERFEDIVQHEVPASAREMQLEKDLEDPTGREIREALRLLAQDRPEEALAIVRTEIDLAPGDLRPRLIEARTLLLLDRPQEALEASERAVALAPESADALYQRGAVRMALDDLEAAERDFRQALEANPDHPATLSDLAVLLTVRGQRDEARRLLERFLEIRPDDPVARRHLEKLGGGG